MTNPHLWQERLPSHQSGSGGGSTRPPRSSIFDTNVRYPPRIPRLIRRPMVHRDLEGNIVVDRPSSIISSAISMTREYANRRPPPPPVANSIGADAYHRIDDSLSSVYDLHCATDDKAVDLNELCQMEIQESPSNTSYTQLGFDIVYEDGGRYSSSYCVENILKNDGAVYWYVNVSHQKFICVHDVLNVVAKYIV